MANRQQVFTAYALAYARQETGDYADSALTLASALGVVDVQLGKSLAEVPELERRLMAADAFPDAADARALDAAEEDAALTRAGAADLRRQLDIAQSQARANRELHEAAVADVLELRCDRDDLRLLLANVRDALGAPAGEALTITADRVMRELQQAKEALVQARAKCDELRRIVTGASPACMTSPRAT